MDKDGDKVITNHVCQHGGKNWPYWFRKMGLLASLIALLSLLLLEVVIIIIIVIISISINLDILRASLFSVITLHCAKELQVSVEEGVLIILLYYFFKLVCALQSSMTGSDCKLIG